MKIQHIILIFLAISISGCVSFKSKSEVASVTHLEPSTETIRKVDTILYKAMMFQKSSEKIALSEGRELTKDEARYAVELGIKHPEKIRIQYQWSLPKPHDKELLIEFNKLGFGSLFEGGRTSGYGIYVKSYFPYKSSIIRHELVHVKQAESMGLRPFTRQYLIEAMTYDYFDMPLEAEAFNKTEGDKF